MLIKESLVRNHQTFCIGYLSFYICVSYASRGNVLFD